MMTDTEVKAACLGRALQSEPKSFGAEQAKTACDVLVKLYDAKKLDAGTFSRVNAFLGNHSAIRQWCVAHGFLATDDDALTIAVKTEITRLDKELENL